LNETKEARIICILGFENQLKGFSENKRIPVYGGMEFSNDIILEWEYAFRVTEWAFSEPQIGWN
jgi:hypothetical protein